MGNLASASIDSGTLARVDSLLNELDRLARSECPPAQFYEEILRRLKLLLAATDCCILACIHPGRWSAIATTSQAFRVQAEQQLSQSAARISTGLPTQWIDPAVSDQWLGCSFGASNWSAGGIVAKLPATSQAVSDPARVVPEACGNRNEEKIALAPTELLSAFAEIVNRYHSLRGHLHSESQSTEIRSIVCAILTCNRPHEVDKLLVDGARCLVDADRVSLLRSHKPTANNQTIAISGTPKVDVNSNIVIALNKLSLSTVLDSASTDELTSLASENGSAVAIAIPIFHPGPSVLDRTNTTRKLVNFLVLEWSDKDRFVSNAFKIESILPWLKDAWQFRSQMKSVAIWPTRFLKWATGMVCLALAVVYFAVPTEMTILAQGTLQPLEQRFVFAPAEGFVDRIFVADSQCVQAGEVVATISSPTLELQINQVSAEIGLTEQKRDGLNITLNQLKPTDDPANLTGSRLAGEVQELEARRANLVEQKLLLDREQERLRLRSPISGTVIAWEVEKYLENRPVRRGDLLLRIAALEHQWRLESIVVDWESGYVVDAYRATLAKNKPLTIEFVLASSPQEKRNGKISRIGNTMIDVGGSQQLEVIVDPDTPLENPRMGTSVRLSIPCGQFPRWFVWTRSIVDAVRRRFWF